MAMTFPFRGLIPDWLNPDTDGHRYWKPAEIPVKFSGRDFLDGASAVYAFAPEDLRQKLRVADEGLRLLGVPTIHDRKKTLEYIEHSHREGHEIIPDKTPEFGVWKTWDNVLKEIWNSFNWPLHNGQFVAFGDLNLPGSHSSWIHPLAWMELKPDLHVPGKFSAESFTFWNVRIVNTLEIIAREEAQRNPTKRIKEHTDRRQPPSLSTLTEWYQSSVMEWSLGMPVPSLKDDLRDAKNHFGQESRGRVMQLRHDLAPSEWNVGTPGRKRNAQ